VNLSRARRYRNRWRRYQQRSDFLTMGKELYFMGKAYDGDWLANWAVRREELIRRYPHFRSGQIIPARGWRGR